MQVLVMVFHFPPISGGGVVVITDIVNKLAELGNEVTVITPNLDWNGEQYNPNINSKIKVVRTETPSKSRIKVAARRCQANMKKQAMELGKHQKFDFVFSIFHPFHLVPKAAVEVAKELQIPSIVKIDDAIYEKTTGIKSIQRRVEKMINSKTLRTASKVLVSNNDTAKVIINEYGVIPEKISIVPNGVELSLFNSSKQKNPKKVVFADGEDENTLKAAIAFKNSKLGIPILVGKKDKIKEQLKNIGYSENFNIEIVNSNDKKKREKYSNYLFKKLQRKEGLLERDCDRMVRNDRVIWASCMVSCGDADGAVTGNTRKYAASLEKINKVIDSRPGEIMFGLNMIVNKGKTVFIADTAVHEYPSSEQLSEIAISAENTPDKCIPVFKK